MTKAEPRAHGKMAPKMGSEPGLETDGHGNVIPLAQRTADDRAKALGTDRRSVKNPQNEAENPAPMPKDQQGQGAAPQDSDPQGQQGVTR